MPVNVVHTAKDEHLWELAKEQAAKQEKSKDWGYIMGIYQKMKGNKTLEKGLGIPVHKFSAYGTYNGLVPGATTPLAVRAIMNPEVLLTEKPPAFTIDRFFDAPILTAQDTVRNLGLSKALESNIYNLIEKEADSSLNQLAFQKSINSSLMESGLSPELQSIINSRAKKYYNVQLKKADVRLEISKAVQIHAPSKGALLSKDPSVTAAEQEEEKKTNKELGVESPKPPMNKSSFFVQPLSKALKGETLGGKFIARVTKEGTHKYYYDEQKYKEDHGTHISGEDANKLHIHEQVQKTCELAGKAGIDIKAFKPLVEKFGASEIHASVKNHVDTGTLKFTKGKFIYNK